MRRRPLLTWKARSTRSVTTHLHLLVFFVHDLSAFDARIAPAPFARIAN